MASGAFARLGAQGGATPVPAASPVATPLATPFATPGATPLPEPTLAIVRDQQPSYEAEPRRGGTLRLLRPPAEPGDFNPASFRQDFQVPVSYLDPLLRVDPVTMEPRPWLAESWQWSDDGRTITYRLRPDVLWHDGTPLTAHDVRFSFFVYRDDVDSGVRSFFTSMEDAEAIDDRTLRVRLVGADSGWLPNASTQLVFQREQYAEYWLSRAPGERTLAGFDWLSGPPIGTGPWRIASFSPAGVAFVRNDDYWAEPPWFDRLMLRWQEDADDRLEAWRRGEVDLLWPVRATEIGRAEGRPGRLYAADAASVMFAAFNFQNPVRPWPALFDDLRLRRALSLAIDRGRYGREVFAGFTRAAAAGTVAQPWAHDAGLTSPRRDLAAARALLAELGWADYDGNGMLEDWNGIPFDLTAILRNDSRPELIEVLRGVKRDLVELGVALRLQLQPPEQFQERWIKTRDYDLIAFAYDLYPGFTDFDLYGSAWDIRTNPQGWNPGGYRNQEVDAAIADVLGAPALEDQRAPLRRLQRAADEDLFGLWFGFPQDLILVAADVLGFRPNKLWQTADTWRLWRAER